MIVNFNFEISFRHCRKPQPFYSIIIGMRFGVFVAVDFFPLQIKITQIALLNTINYIDLVKSTRLLTAVVEWILVSVFVQILLRTNKLWNLNNFSTHDYSSSAKFKFKLKYLLMHDGELLAKKHRNKFWLSRNKNITLISFADHSNGMNWIILIDFIALQKFRFTVNGQWIRIEMWRIIRS